MDFCCARGIGAGCADLNRGPDVVSFTPAPTLEGVGLSEGVFKAPDYRRSFDHIFYRLIIGKKQYLSRRAGKNL